MIRSDIYVARTDQSHYEVLGIEPDASLQLIEAVTHLLVSPFIRERGTQAEAEIPTEAEL